MLQAYGEGFEILEKHRSSISTSANLPSCGCHGSVVRRGCSNCWCLALPRRSRAERYPRLCRRHRRRALDGRGGDRRKRPAPVITLSLLARMASRQRRIVQRQGRRGAAQSVRRTRGKERNECLTRPSRRQLPPAATALPAIHCARTRRTSGSPIRAAIVFFGASGDLFKRMLLPAVYSMRLAIRCRPTSRSSALPARRSATTSFASTAVSSSTVHARRQETAGRALGRFLAENQLHHRRLQGHPPLPSAQRSFSQERRRAWNGRQPPLLSLDAAAGLSRDHQAPQKGGARTTSDERAGRASSSRSRSGRIWSRRARCNVPSRPSFPRTRSTASITTSAKSRCKTSSRCALPTRFSSRSGTATTWPTCRSRRPRRSASRNAAATTITPARCAT